jgi:hydroxymethylglutaryl-CoA lyase
MMRKSIEIFEVGPRDGFQNIKEYIPLEAKLEIIGGICDAGIRRVQATSFVSPKAVPQMRDAREVVEGCLERHPGVDFFALVPNLRGARSAMEAGLKKISFVASLSQTHNKANIKRTRAQSLEELKCIVDKLPNLAVALDLATAFGCPFEGLKEADEVVEFLSDYAEMGIRQVTLCDTIGLANPAQIRRTVKAAQKAFPEIEWSIHIHDTRNMGMASTLAAVEAGISNVQSTLGGLGGCPFAPGASGNLATEDLVFMLKSMGYELGIDLDKLLAASLLQKRAVMGGVFSGHLLNVKNYSGLPIAPPA